MRRLARALLLSALCLVLFAPPVIAQMSASDVGEALTCQCGCGLTVATCNHLNCGFAIPVREDIQASLERGETGEEIIARYVAEYGEKVLSSPTTEGFNLLAWIGPYAAVFLGALGILWIVRRWSHREPVPADGQEGGAVSDLDRRRIADELENLD